MTLAKEAIHSVIKMYANDTFVHKKKSYQVNISYKYKKKKIFITFFKRNGHLVIEKIPLGINIKTPIMA